MATSSNRKGLITSVQGDEFTVHFDDENEDVTFDRSVDNLAPVYFPLIVVGNEVTWMRLETALTKSATLVIDGTERQAHG